MKRVIIFTLLLASFLFITAAAKSKCPRGSFQETGGPPDVAVRYRTGEEIIKPWYDAENDIWYYFLPSCMKEEGIWCGELTSVMYIDGIRETGDFHYIAGEKYHVNNGNYQFTIEIRPSENVPSIFIHTESGSMDYIHAHKDHEEPGEIVSLDMEGNTEYVGDLDKISGHGNSAWEEEKKPYHIKLSSVGSLCSLSAAKDWNLLALWYDGDKIHSELAFDIAKILGSKYISDAAWADLYLNGEYRGLYLLTSAVNGQQAFQNEDAFLLEKEIDDDAYRYRYEGKENFRSDHGNRFVVERPKQISEDQMDSIVGTVQAAEDAIERQDYEGHIDVPSFAAQFLVDEISLNYDAFVASSYLYKLSGDEKLYAGPAWDYDGAFGEYLKFRDSWMNTEGTVLGARGSWQLDWYEMLHETETFQNCLHDILEEKLPELQRLFTEGISESAGWIEESVVNDEIRWNRVNEEENGNTGSYQTWENNVRYLQYFCLNRLKCLCERYQVAGVQAEWSSENKFHTVNFVVDGETVYSLTVEDGDTVQINEIDSLKDYTEGKWRLSYSDSKYFNPYFPVLEDCILIYE